MKKHRIRTFVFVICAVLLVYLVGYCVVIERDVLRPPDTTAASSELWGHWYTYPVIRGNTGQYNATFMKLVWSIFRPAWEVDRHMVRQSYWESNPVTNKTSEVKP